MRVLLGAFLLGSLSFAPLAHARSGEAPAFDAFSAGRIPESLALGRRLAESEANLRASGLAAGVLIGSVLGRDEGDTGLVVSIEQRDAVLAAMKKYNYLQHLAQTYASVLQVAELREVAALYADPRMSSFWTFQSAAIAAVLSEGIGLEVQLPDSPIEPLSAGEALAAREGIAQLVAAWFEGIEAQIDVDALISGIQGRTTANEIEEVLALTQDPITTTLRTAQKTPRLSQFDRKELESPRFRNALSNALLSAD